MKRNLLIAEVRRTPWALEPTYGATMMGVLAGWQRGEQASEETLSGLRAGREVTRARQQATARAAGGAIAVLPLHGIISQRAGMMQDYSGGVSTQQFSAALAEAISDDTVSQVLISISSPGGSVFGVQELASEIMQARVSKPIIGFADSTAASAAYWLGAACLSLASTRRKTGCMSRPTRAWTRSYSGASSPCGAILPWT